MTEKEGVFSIPTRLLLKPEHRAKLEAIVRERDIDLAELVSQIVAEYLDRQTEQALVVEPAVDTAADLRGRRTELARLRARRDAAGKSAPRWLVTYIIALESEIERLERDQ